MAVVEIPDKFLTDRQGKQYVLYAGLLDAAHSICPYSKATHGNVTVVTNLV